MKSNEEITREIEERLVGILRGENEELHGKLVVVNVAVEDLEKMKGDSTVILLATINQTNTTLAPPSPSKSEIERALLGIELASQEGI